MLNRIKSSIRYFKGIRKGTSIPMIFINIDLTKANTDKNCTISINPTVRKQLSVEDNAFIKEHINIVIDKIRDNVDFNK